VILDTGWFWRDRNGFSTASATLLDYKVIRRESIMTEDFFNNNSV